MSRKPITYLTREQADSVEQKVATTDFEIAVFLALHLGLRRKEITSLRWADYDHDSGVVIISSENDYRVIELTAKQAVYLTACQQRRKPPVTGYVCTDEKGCRIPPDRLTRAIRGICGMCGIPCAGLKELRHTAIVNKIIEGMSMVDLQEWAGYSEYTAAFLIYADVRKKMKRIKV